jgi:hypothetical protein
MQNADYKKPLVVLYAVLAFSNPFIKAGELQE